jgi:hypothetical protein
LALDLPGIFWRTQWSIGVHTPNLQRKQAGALRISVYGACGLFFCAAKRSGAFPPDMPAGLRACVSRHVPNLDGVVVCTVKRFHKSTDRGIAPNPTPKFDSGDTSLLTGSITSSRLDLAYIRR